MKLRKANDRKAIKGKYGSNNNSLSLFDLFVFKGPEKELFDFRTQVCKVKGCCLTLGFNAVIDSFSKVMPSQLIHTISV